MTIRFENYIEKQREEGRQEGILKGREEGRRESVLKGKLELAQKIAKTYGIEEAIQLSGFTKKEIETGKIIP